MEHPLIPADSPVDSRPSSQYHSSVQRRKDHGSKAAFGQALRRLRLQKRLSQGRLAEATGIHRTYIGDVERGRRNIALINMTRIARALGVPLSRIMLDMEQNS